MKKPTIDTTSPGFLARAVHCGRTWHMTAFTNFDDVKRAEYRYWQS